jgi:amidase
MLRFFGSLIGRPVEESDVEPSTWYWYERGLRRDAGDLAGDLAWLDGFRRRFAAWWSAGFDLLVAPAFPRPAPRLDSFSEGGERTRALIDLIRATAPVNTAGQPALAVPAGFTSDGLPVGAQLVAAYGHEDVLVRTGSQLEDAVGWREWKPPAYAG